MSDAGLAHFKDCKNLTILDLGGTQVSDAGLAHFKDCKNLTDLGLDGTQVSDAGLAHFKDCKNLTHLDLSGTQVSDAGLAHFKDCKNLTDLSLSGHEGERRGPGPLQGLQEPDAPRPAKDEGHRCEDRGVEEGVAEVQDRVGRDVIVRETACEAARGHPFPRGPPWTPRRPLDSPRLRRDGQPPRRRRPPSRIGPLKPAGPAEERVAAVLKPQRDACQGRGCPFSGTWSDRDAYFCSRFVAPGRAWGASARLLPRPRWHRSSASPCQQVQDPAASHMQPWLPAVAEDAGVLAPGFVEGIGQNGHSVESTIVVDGLGDLDHGAVVPRQPRRINGNRTEGIAESSRSSPQT